MSWGGIPLSYLNEVGSERQSDFLQVTRLDSAGRCVLLRFVNSGPALGSGCEVHPTHPGPLPGCLPAAVCLQGSPELGGHSPGPSLTCSLIPKRQLPPFSRKKVPLAVLGWDASSVWSQTLCCDASSDCLRSLLQQCVCVVVGGLACPHSVKFGQNNKRLAVKAATTPTTHGRTPHPGAYDKLWELFAPFAVISAGSKIIWVLVPSTTGQQLGSVCIPFGPWVCGVLVTHA